ncbi:major facilitator superfamily domain-containing protein [Mycena sanguinolenta]|nr:major facilitator superfamily domain-containing protein [Mycena sanguinolenta]
MASDPESDLPVPASTQSTETLDEKDAPAVAVVSVVSPHDWPARKKWGNVILISVQATLSPVCSTFLAVGAQQVDQDLHVTSLALRGMPVALYVLGLGLGPLFLAPLSEMFGRRVVYIVSFGLFSILNVGCALVKTDSGLIILRLLTGIAGSAGPALGGGSIGDMFTREKRGGAQTYKPYLDARANGKRSAPTTIGFQKGITRPIRMFLFSPIVTAMGLYMALVYGVLYLHLVTIPLLFGPKSISGLFTYGWKNGNEGLAYLGAGIGCFLATGFCLLTMNRSYRALAKKYGEQRPEFRMLWMQICIQTYLVDAFNQYAASALAATIILRSLCGAIFSIVGAKLYENLDYGWGTSVLAFISVAALPIPALFWVYGPQLREKKFAG